jgi:DNA-binding NarL/FixJ family response regulator
MVRALGKSTYRGGLYLCPECGGVARPTILSPAELEVLRRYAGGQTTAEIAANRGRSLKTVEQARGPDSGPGGAPGDRERIGAP